MRLRSDLWVAAYLRRCGVEGAPAALRRRGAREAGAIFVKIDCLDGASVLYGPAPQSPDADLGRGVERLFMRIHGPERIDNEAAEKRLERELSFDPDLWIVEVEDRDGEPRLDLAARASDAPRP